MGGVDVSRSLLYAAGWPFRQAARGLVLLIDLTQRRLLGIAEFSRHPDCIARIARSACRAAVTLPDGTEVKAGEVMGEIHLWNERVPEVPPSGPDLAWALVLRRKILRSLRELAAYVEQAPEYTGARVIHGGTSFTRRGDVGDALTGGDLAARLGFHVVRGAPPGILLRFRDLIQNVYYLALVWAFNPRSLKTKGFGRLARIELYMTRATLMERYGPVAARQTAASRE